LTLPDPIAAVLDGRERWAVECGDSLALLRTLPDACVDAVVTDPPAGIGFLGKDWDRDKGGREKWIAWLAEILTECRRVMKPGAHAVVWALPRTSHWTGMAIEDAGFQIRECTCHVFGSGMPKSKKAIDAVIQAGQPYPNPDPAAYDAIEWAQSERAGYGSGLKPAYEFWWVARKELDGTLGENLIKHGTGCLNIDATRVATNPEDFAQLAAGVEAIRERGGSMQNSWKNSSDLSGANPANPLGRWPSNLLLSHDSRCVRVGVREVKSSDRVGHDGRKVGSVGSVGRFTDHMHSEVRHAGPNGRETISAFRCVDSCPVRRLDEQSGDRPGMSGGGLHRDD
jgi:hypothetical protein